MEGLRELLKRSYIKHPDDSTNQRSAISREIPVDLIVPSEFQPRLNINSTELEELGESILEIGLINPILLRKRSKDKKKYEIIAGERRWRAVCNLGWKSISAVVTEYSDELAQAAAIVENIQRARLTPIEEALGYQVLINNYTLTHLEVSKYVGKPRSTISNFLRLLDLDSEVQKIVNSGGIDIGHAKLLLNCSHARQQELAALVKEKKISVKQLEKIIKESDRIKQDQYISPDCPEAILLEKKLKIILGKNVKITVKDNSLCDEFIFTSVVALKVFLDSI